MAENGLALPTDQLNEGFLTAQLKESLQASLFSGRLRITPRRVNEVAAEVAASFLEFRDRGHEEAAYSYGERLATEGVGHRAILSLAETLRRVCWESGDRAHELLRLAGRYTFSLLEGYMAGREAYLLQEQDRAHRALDRARERGSA